MDTKKLIRIILIIFSFIVVMSLLTVLFSINWAPIVVLVCYATVIAAFVYCML